MGGLAAVVRCFLESRSSIIECCLCWKYQVNFRGGLQLLPGVFLKDDLPSLNVACVGSARSTSGVLQLLSGVFLKDDLPSLNVACVGSTMSTSGGVAAVVRCPFER